MEERIKQFDLFQKINPTYKTHSKLSSEYNNSKFRTDK